MQFEPNNYYQANIYRGISNRQLQRDARRTASFRYNVISLRAHRTEYVNNNSSAGWLKRKATALPGVVIGALKISLHTARIFLFVFHHNKLAFLKLHVYYVVRDLQEIVGKIVILFSDRVGSYLVEESAFQKKCYDIHLSRIFVLPPADREDAADIEVVEENDPFREPEADAAPDDNAPPAPIVDPAPNLNPPPVAVPNNSPLTMLFMNENPPPVAVLNSRQKVDLVYHLLNANIPNPDRALLIANGIEDDLQLRDTSLTFIVNHHLERNETEKALAAMERYHSADLKAPLYKAIFNRALENRQLAVADRILKNEIQNPDRVHYTERLFNAYMNNAYMNNNDIDNALKLKVCIPYNNPKRDELISRAIERLIETDPVKAMNANEELFNNLTRIQFYIQIAKKLWEADNKIVFEYTMTQLFLVCYKELLLRNTSLNAQNNKIDIGAIEPRIIEHVVANSGDIACLIMNDRIDDLSIYINEFLENLKVNNAA